MNKFVGTGHSSSKKRIYRAAVSQRLRNTDLEPAIFSALPYVHQSVHDSSPPNPILRQAIPVHDVVTF